VPRIESWRDTRATQRTGGRRFCHGLSGSAARLSFRRRSVQSRLRAVATATAPPSSAAAAVAAAPRYAMARHDSRTARPRTAARSRGRRRPQRRRQRTRLFTPARRQPEMPAEVRPLRRAPVQRFFSSATFLEEFAPAPLLARLPSRAPAAVAPARPAPDPVTRHVPASRLSSSCYRSPARTIVTRIRYASRRI